jgi:hypothetical protein
MRHFLDRTAEFSGCTPEPAALTLKCQTLRPVFIGWERLFESALNPRRYALYVHQAAVTCVSYPVVNRPV